MKMTNEQGVVKLWVVLLITMMAIAVGVGISLIGSPQASAQPTTCGETTTVGIGGVDDPDAAVYKQGTVDVRVKYSARFGAVEEGVAALDKAVKTVRTNCPGTHVVVAGFSQGAQITHIWTQRSAAVLDKEAVLFSDPKQIKTGLAFYARDNNFGGTPAVSICNDTDIICNLPGWNISGYPVEHLKYNFDPGAYAGGATRVIWE